MKKVKFIWYVLTFLPILILILGYFYPLNFFSSQESIRNFVMSYGAFAPIIFVLIQVLQVVITPFSHYVVGLAGGFVFGVWWGFFFNWIGRCIGSVIAFSLGKKYGRNIIKHVVKKDTLDKYDYMFEKGTFLLFLAYFLPLFPDDELSYLAGISSMKSKVYIPIAILGHIVGSLALAYMGNGIKSVTEPMFIILSLSALFCAGLFAWKYKKVNSFKTSKNT